LARDIARLPKSSETSEVLRHWLDLSLIQFHHTDRDGDARYTIHPVVRDYLLGRLDEEHVRALHARAAAYYGAPFVEAARQAVAQSGEARTGEAIESLARDRRGVVGDWTHQAQDMRRARWAMERALAWGEHLFQAGQADTAGEIVTAVWLVLARWGQRDLAKALLRRSIATLEGFDQAVAQGNLANLLQEEGRLAEALEIHEQLYETFAALDAKENMAVALTQMSNVHLLMGDYEQAIEKEGASLQIKRERGDEEGQAISLHQLSVLHMLKEDYQTALTHSQEAEKLNRKLDRQVGIALNLHQQGLIFNQTDRRGEALERFSQSLEISRRRIRDESGAADSLGELGKLLMDAGQLREAIAAFSECLEIHQRHNDPKMGIDLSMLGEIHEQQGEYPAALEKYQQARHIFQQVGMANEVRIAQQYIARVRGKMGG
jgi:tetratricopeptide (TPR) repeat protein